MRSVIHHSDYELEYYVYGNGDHIVFAFHGFNNNAQDFEIAEEILGEGYTIVAINAFFHGSSNAKDDVVFRGLSTNEMQSIFNEFQKLFPATKYLLLGYSMGGRFVLKFLELFPEKIERAILLAPDGIKISRFYTFLTGTAMGKYTLKKLIENPAIVLKMARLIRSLRLVSKKKYDFAVGNIDSPEKRILVYHVWLILRKIVSKRILLRETIRKFAIPVHLFYGRHDRIIPFKNGYEFRKGVEEFVSVNVLESGHRLMKEKTLREMVEELNKIKNDSR